MAEKDKSGTVPGAKRAGVSRKLKLAEELRRNLQRRKQQARAREQDMAGDPEDPVPESGEYGA